MKRFFIIVLCALCLHMGAFSEESKPDVSAEILLEQKQKLIFRVVGDGFCEIIDNSIVKFNLDLGVVEKYKSIAEFFRFEYASPACLSRTKTVSYETINKETCLVCWHPDYYIVTVLTGRDKDVQLICLYDNTLQDISEDIKRRGDDEREVEFYHRYFWGVVDSYPVAGPLQILFPWSSEQKEDQTADEVALGD